MAACRLCDAPLATTFVDLGLSPLCESFPADGGAETFYPLRVFICDRCLLVQLPVHVPAEEIFSHYAYFSSYSTSWVEHARQFALHAAARFELGASSLVYEVASNDGYLLAHFQALGIPAVGIEPAANVAAAALAKGIETEICFLDSATAAALVDRHGRADLVVANNVYAHVPDLRDFTAGLATLVAPHGVITLEFPHLLRLIEGRQYDTIYHEHFQYLSLRTAILALATAGLTVIDVQQLPTHGGSLRVYAGAARGQPAPAVADVLALEDAAGLNTVAGHLGFDSAVFQVKRDLLSFLLQARDRGQLVAGYGAPGKANTLLNHCGVRTDLLAYTVDRNPAKQGRLLPGTHIPVHHPDRLSTDRPPYILVLPWNLRTELSEQLSYARQWGAQLVYPLPQLDLVAA